MPRGVAIKLAVVVAATVTMVVLSEVQVRGVNGPSYWTWSWRKLALWPLLPAMLAAATPFVLAQLAFRRGRTRLAVALLAVATLALQLAALACQPPVGLRRLALIVEHPDVTSYWMDASILHAQRGVMPASQWIAQYEDLIPLLHRHAKYKPPGLMLYYLMWIALLGSSDASAVVGGIGVAVVAALAPVACFWMVKVGVRGPPGTEVDAARVDADAFASASLLAICPSLVLFFPMFDQTYATIGCVVLGLWHLALRLPRRWHFAAVACGAMLALALFMSYIFLVLGCFIVTAWLLRCADGGGRALWRGVAAGAIALATVGVLYTVLYAATAFNPIATFHSISAEQSKDLVPLVRPFPQHILFDVIDFALGSGWVGALLAVIFVVHAGRRLFGRDPRMRLALTALIEIAVVAAAALLPGETARLWLILMPLLMTVAGLELSSWPWRARLGVYACLVVALVAIGRNMTFIYMGPDLDGPRH